MHFKARRQKSIKKLEKSRQKECLRQNLVQNPVICRSIVRLEDGFKRIPINNKLKIFRLVKQMLPKKIAKSNIYGWEHLNKNTKFTDLIGQQFGLV